MRLVTRLTLAFLGVVICIISLHEYRQLGDRQADFERDMDRTHALVAATLAESVELVETHEGNEAARAMVAQVNDRRRGDLRVRWVCDGATEDEPPIPCERLTAGTVVTQGGRRFTLVPLVLQGRPRGAIEVSESPAHEGDWVKEHVSDAVVLAVMTVAGVALAAFVLGWWLVARPTRLLREKARAVGRGELEGDVVLHSNDELQEVGEEMNAMCRQLATAQSALRHADRLATVGRLATGLAHELGTPLNVIEARAGLIAEDMSADATVHSSARIIIGCTEQVTKLVRQLLDFARTRTTERASVSLLALAKTVAELLEPLAAQAQVRLVVRAGPDAWTRGDAVLLQQALTNLVVNAIHASTAGGVVTLETGRQASWAVLSVRDEGVGMTTEVRASIFEPFFTTKPVGEGTGLGLPITVSIVEEHQGVLEVESAPGKGSVFVMKLAADLTPREHP